MQALFGEDGEMMDCAILTGAFEMGDPVAASAEPFIGVDKK